MNAFWTWYANLPNFSIHHPVVGLIISVLILLIIFMVPVLALRLAFKLLIAISAVVITLICLAFGCATNMRKDACQNYEEVLS